MIKNHRIALCCALLVPTMAIGQSRPFETTDEARRRHQAERYQVDRELGGQPLGGYRERLGDPGGAEPRYSPPPTYRPRDDEPRRDDRFSTDRGFNDPVTRPRR